MSTIERWKQRVRSLKTELYAIYLAYRDPRVPWYARVVAACVVAYAFSPIDLIPDPIPILGYLDDLIIVPLGVALAVRMIPSGVLDECRTEVREGGVKTGPKGTVAAVAIVAVWMLLAALGVYLVGGALGYL